jgi:membrane-bound lytic murein transglycosylase D
LFLVSFPVSLLAQKLSPKPLPPTRLNFCGELVPLEQQDVSQRLAVMLAARSGRGKQVNALKIRSLPYFAVIELMLKSYGIPNDFKYLPLIESAWQANVVSSAGAVGYWQFMDDTAKDLGLNIAPGTDERTDLRKSTDAACRYIRFLYRSLGSWTLVAASYNGGIGMIQRKVARQGHRDYYRLAMNEETSFYLYRILAMKELFTNTAFYGGQPGAGGLAIYDEDPYEREREQARRMGWLQDSDPELTGVAIEPLDALLGPQTPLVDSLLAELLTQKPDMALVVQGDVEAELIKAGKPVVGQSWAFRITQAAEIGEQTLQPGDVLYAVVDEIDASGHLFLRATKALKSADNEIISLTLVAINPATGSAGVPLPKTLKPGWRVQWQISE